LEEASGLGTTVGGAGFSVSVSSAVDFRLLERERMVGAAVEVARRATDEREERVEKALASMVVSVGLKGATVQIRRARAAWDRRGILVTL
jgi:hypothetical protein